MSKYVVAVLLVLVGSTFAANAQDPAPPEPRDKLKVFYFGNSLTGCTNPEWHTELGKSAGREWINDYMLGAGWQIWQHRMVFENAKVAGSAAENAQNPDYTLDETYVHRARGISKKFETTKYDAIVIQPFAQKLVDVCSKKWGMDLGKEMDLGDIESSRGIIARYLALNPDGEVLFYQGMAGLAVAGELRAKLRKEEKREPNHDEMEPLRARGQYIKQWEEREYLADEQPWKCNASCRDFHGRLFKAMIEAFPELAKSNRLRMIPVGEVFCALDKKMKAGKFPGIDNVGYFSCDGTHTRAGLPRYTAAATFYAVLFNSKPHDLDWRIFNDKEKYGDDRNNDEGALLEITPERTKIVNDTIWEVVKEHPYTGM